MRLRTRPPIWKVTHFNDKAAKKKIREQMVKKPNGQETKWSESELRVWIEISKRL